MTKKLRPSFAVRWHAPSGTAFVPIPVRLLELGVELDLSPAEVLTLIAICNFWRSDTNSARVSVSLSQLARLVPLDRTRLSRMIWRLANKGLIGRFAEEGKAPEFDLDPLIRRLLLPRNTTVAPAQHQLLLRGNGTVAPAHETVAFSGSSVEPSGSGEDIRGVGPGLGDAPDPPLPPQGTASGNGHGADHLGDIRRRLGGHRAPKPLSAAERTAHAAEQRRKAAELPADELPR